MSISLKVDFSNRFEKLVNSNFANVIDSALSKTIIEGENICRKEAPIKDGNLKRSIGRLHPTMGTVCLISHGAPYWVDVQYGTAAHIITGNPILAWKSKKDNKMHFARKVNHPGTKADPFVTRTAKLIISNQIFEKHLESLMTSNGYY